MFLSRLFTTSTLALALLAPALSHSAAPFLALQHVEAVPMTSQAMDAVKGKASPLQLFLSQFATATSLGQGVTLYTFNPSGASGSASASWNTGSSSGSGVKPLP